MTDTPEHSDDDEDFTFDRSELDAIRAETDAFMRQRYIFWIIRWVIGFALIALIVWFYPDWSWLWWVGAGVALFSLAVLIFGQRALRHKMEQTERTVNEAEAEIRALKDEDE